MTKDHSTANSEERKRILKEGGAISINKNHGLVEGLLLATRGFGNYGDRKLRKVVLPTPSCVSLGLDPSSGLLVLGSRGLWDGVQPEEIAHVVRRCIRNCQRCHSHTKATKEQLRDLCSFTLQEPAENQEAAIEKPPCRGGMEDQEPSASYRQPKDPTNREDAGRAAVEDVNYEQLAASICSKLLQRAMASGSRENISVMVILLQGLEVLGVQSEDGV